MGEKDSIKSWLFLAAMTLTCFLEVGTIKAFSILLPEIKEQLVTETWIVGSSISFISGFGYLIGLSSSAWTRLSSPRVCVIISGSTASFGLIVCACTTSVPLLILGLFLTGFLLFQENIVMGIVPIYFDKYYEFAVTINSLSYPLAIMIMPQVTQVLEETYGWRSTLFILSALNLHAVPCGALLKPIQVKRTDVCTPLLPAVNNDPVNASYNIYDISGVALFNNVPFIAQVLLPGFVFGYTLTGWMIYIVSFAMSKSASMTESAVVATCGGVGMLIFRIALPFVIKLMTYKQLLYASSLLEVISFVSTTLASSVLGMCMTSFLFGMGIGIHGVEVYIAAKYTVDETKYDLAIAWCHLSYGIASIISGTLTGLIFDLTGSFTLSFAILAGISSLTAVSLGIEDIWARLQDQQEE